MLLLLTLLSGIAVALVYKVNHEQHLQGADSGNTVAYYGAEAGMVVEGGLDLWINDLCFRLAVGDSFSFKSTDKHRCQNPGTIAARVVWVITPPHY